MSCAQVLPVAGQYIFQASIEPPEAFYRNLDKRIIKFGVSRPDLLLIDSVPLPDGKRSLIIIDAKSSRRTKFSQQVQVNVVIYLLRSFGSLVHLLPGSVLRYALTNFIESRRHRRYRYESRSRCGRFLLPPLLMVWE